MSQSVLVKRARAGGPVQADYTVKVINLNEFLVDYGTFSHFNFFIIIFGLVILKVRSVIFSLSYSKCMVGHLKSVI